MQCKEKWFITYLRVIIEQCLLRRHDSFFYTKNDKIRFMLNVIMSGEKVGGWTRSITTKCICFCFVFLYIFFNTVTLTYVTVLFLHSFSHPHCILAFTCIVFMFVCVLVPVTVFCYFFFVKK